MKGSFVSMNEHRAACRCGQLRVTCIGEPLRVSVCHCLNCQRRSGSAFAVQARFPTGNVHVDGETTDWSPDGGEARTTFRFCPRCGSTVTYSSEAMPGITAVAVGAFADPAFPSPSVSGFEERRHSWTVVLGSDVEHFD